MRQSTENRNLFSRPPQLSCPQFADNVSNINSKLYVSKDGSYKNKNYKHKTIRRNNNVCQALSLPSIMNINPRSIYNSVDQFRTFIEQQNISVIFMSESWEREYLSLNELIQLENYQVISNVFQRKGRGGRPALIVEKICLI